MMKVGWCNHEAKNLHGKPIIFSPNFTEVLLFIQHSHTLFFYSFPLSLLKAHQKQWKERNFLLAFRKWVLFLYFMMVDERRGLGIMRTRVWFAWQFDRHGSWKIASKTHIEMLAANNIHNKQTQFFSNWSFYAKWHNTNQDFFKKFSISSSIFERFSGM